MPAHLHHAVSTLKLSNTLSSAGSASQDPPLATRQPVGEDAFTKALYNFGFLSRPTILPLWATPGHINP